MPSYDKDAHEGISHTATLSVLKMSQTLRRSDCRRPPGCQAGGLQKRPDPAGALSHHPIPSSLLEDMARSRWAPGDHPGQPAQLFR